MKVQEGSILKYQIFQIFQPPLGFNVYQKYHIMGLLNEWLPTGKLIKVDTTFRTDTTYEKELISALPLTGNSLHKAETEYHRKFGHIFERIQHIALMNIIDICYATCHLSTQTLEPTLPGFQSIKLFVKYLDSHPHKHIFYTSNYYDGSNVIRLTWSGEQVEDYTTRNFSE